MTVATSVVDAPEAVDHAALAEAMRLDEINVSDPSSISRTSGSRIFAA